MNEELNMETMEEIELEGMEEMEVTEGSSIVPLALTGIGIGLLGVGIGFRKKIKARLEEATVNRMTKKGYVIYKIDKDLDNSDQDDSEDVE